MEFWRRNINCWGDSWSVRDPGGADGDLTNVYQIFPNGCIACMPPNPLQLYFLTKKSIVKCPILRAKFPPNNTTAIDVKL